MHAHDSRWCAAHPDMQLYTCVVANQHANNQRLPESG